MEKTTNAPRKYSRLTCSISFAYCGAAFRVVAKKWQIQPNRAELLIVIATAQNGATRQFIAITTGQSYNQLHKRLENLTQSGYLAKKAGRGTNANRYILAPLGVKFFNEYKREFSKIKKHYFG